MAPAPFRTFETIPEFCAFARASFPYRTPAPSTAWAGATYDEAEQRALTGDLSRVEASDAMLAKFESLTFETQKRVWRDDVVGAFPNVPAFIAGHPMNMRRRPKAPDERGPITIYVDLFVSSAFDHDAIQRRGAAVLALARILTMARAVELHIGYLSHNDNNNPCGLALKIDTAPLDLARAAYFMVAPEAIRQLIGNAAKGTGARGGIPPFRGDHKAAVARLLPSADHAIIVPGLVSSNSDAFRDPQAWIVAQIRAAAPEMLEEAA